jgi:chemotaxis protein CheZ
MTRTDSLEALSFLKQQSLPEAQQEVQAVTAATSDAANKILDAAEKIQTIAQTLENTVSSRQLLEAVTSIFEASAFQDITGQRLKKVAQALGAMDSGLSTLLDEEDPAPSVFQRRVISVDNPASLLNGPQLPGQAPTQDEIDAMFSNGS